jgi:sulfate transport system ATP-binding protein
VALARALAVDPRILLLDEPFGALDATVRKTLRHELRRIHEATGVTTLFVTHDQDEALELADRVAVLNQGRIEQVGTPQEVAERPASLFVAGFVGQANRLEGQVYDGVFFWRGAELAAPGAADGPAVAFVRADQLVPSGHGPVLRASVRRITPRGALAGLQCVGEGGEVLEVAVARSAASGLEPGQGLALAITGGQVFPRAG